MFSRLWYIPNLTCWGKAPYKAVFNRFAFINPFYSHHLETQEVKLVCGCKGCQHHNMCTCIEKTEERLPLSGVSQYILFIAPGYRTVCRSAPTLPTVMIRETVTQVEVEPFLILVLQE